MKDFELDGFDFNESEFGLVDSEFDERSADELYDEFLGKVKKSQDEFIYVYGRYYNVMTELTGAAMNLFIWMAFNCNVNSGRVFIQSITQREMLKTVGITLGTYYKAVKQLKQKGLIRGGNACYYVNPAYAWKGTMDMRAKFLKIYPKL